MLITSSKCKSGYKGVLYDHRSVARKLPWSVSARGYRSKGFATVIEAAQHYLDYVHNGIPVKQKINTTSNMRKKPMRSDCGVKCRNIQLKKSKVA